MPALPIRIRFYLHTPSTPRRPPLILRQSLQFPHSLFLPIRMAARARALTGRLLPLPELMQASVVDEAL